MNRKGFLILITAVIVICGGCSVCCLGTALFGALSPGEAVSTSRGIFMVPGDAHIDGAGQVPTINIWNAVQRNTVICSLPHRTKVKLLSSQEYAQRVYFEIQSGECRGWVPETFIAD